MNPTDWAKACALLVLAILGSILRGLMAPRTRTRTRTPSSKKENQ